jgi:hypothetical protein
MVHQVVTAYNPDLAALIPADSAHNDKRRQLIFIFG